MTRFFMHVANDTGITVDEDGHDFEGPESAITQASRTAGALLSEELGKGLSDVSIKIYLENDERHRVATVSVSGSILL